MEKNCICFATGNEGKLREIREILKGLPFEVKSMKELGIDADVEENGKTFEENAMIKAKSIMKLCQLPTLADDSGLEVDYMDKAPGIYSARFLGRDTSYMEKIEEKNILVVPEYIKKAIIWACGGNCD